MGKRSHNPRLAKIHRNYNVEEAAKLFGVHKNAVRDWIKRGLGTVDSRRPTLIRGLDLVTFHEDRRARSKRPCGPGQMFCLRCRAPREPADGVVDFVSVSQTNGRLSGRCRECGTQMYRNALASELDRVCGRLAVRFKEAL